jgi:hypothetical protein
MLHTHLHPHAAFIKVRKARGWKSSKKECSFGNMGATLSLPFFASRDKNNVRA